MRVDQAGACGSAPSAVDSFMRKQQTSRRLKASRPHMPGYGMPRGTKGLLPWTWAEERLRKSHNYYVMTVRPDATPHAMPVWGIWADGCFYFSTGAKSVKTRNLAANPSCIVCTEKAAEAVIVEGTATAIERSHPTRGARAALRAQVQVVHARPQDGTDLRSPPEGCVRHVREEVQGLDALDLLKRVAPRVNSAVLAISAVFLRDETKKGGSKRTRPTICVNSACFAIFAVFSS